MNEADRIAEAANEAAVERRFNNALAERAMNVQAQTNRSLNNTWTTSVSADLPSSGELIGRVALRAPSALLDGAKDFYIGTAKMTGADYQVWSWAAPVACTYFRSTSGHHELCDEVVGVRVLARSNGRIVDCQDEAMAEVPAESLFPRRSLKIPRAPGPSNGDPLTIAIDVPSVPASSSPVVPRGGEMHPSTRPILVPRKLPGPAVVPPAQERVPGPPLRVPELLRRTLAAPKSVTMTTVLSTLQSDQYDAIVRPAAASQILQGHPGTGKTIIGVHRAAYLLNAEAPVDARPRGRILLLGPTDEYVTHVSAALRSLVDNADRYDVRSVPSLLESLADLPRSGVPTGSVSWEDASPDLAALIDNHAFARARAEREPGTSVTAADVYAELVHLLRDPPPSGLEPEWVRYLRELPSDLAHLKRLRLRRYRGLLGYIGSRVARPLNLGHIIVDEAQDVHPIEWATLGRLGNAGGWTILGDLNQRRTDHTFASWDDVARLLGIEGDGGDAPVNVLERGYRSTLPIIRYANQLLPARERALYSVQRDGPSPSVERVASARGLVDTSLARAFEFLERVGNGTVAVITVDPASVTSALSRRGWSADSGNAFVWREGSRVLRVLPPERARGLEFDCVVVVEPGAFPQNVGRQGVLYTALTRANRELSVVHHYALPQGMRARS